MQLALDESAYGGAIFSTCRTWRYLLRRHWDPGVEPLVVIGLNPSTADETTDDQTIRRCIGYAQSWGCGGLMMMNAYALRSTDPKGLWRVDDPVGPENDEWLLRVAERYPDTTFLAAWGVHCEPERAETVAGLLPRLACLGLTKAGGPRHPLYMPGDLAPRPYALP